jgi:hypothetical protein
VFRAATGASSSSNDAYLRSGRFAASVGLPIFAGFSAALDARFAKTSAFTRNRFVSNKKR